MSGLRQLGVSIAMALLLGALVLGSLSLSLLEGGYALAEAPTAVYTIAFSGQQVINLVGQTVTPAGGLVLYTPTALACSYPAGWVEVAVLPDQTLNALAQAYGITVEALQRSNCMTHSTSLIPGSFLRVPPAPTQAPTQTIQATPTVCRPPYGWVTYFVRPGDTLARLAAAVQMPPGSLLAANCLSSSYLYPGQTLALPYYPAVYYPTATYRPPTYWPTPWTSPWVTPWATSTDGPSPTFPWLPSTTPTPLPPPLTTWTTQPTAWTPGPTDTTVAPTVPPVSQTPEPLTAIPPTEVPPTVAPPTIAPPTEPPPTSPPPTEPPPPTSEPPTLPPPPTEPPPPTPTTDTGFPFP